MKFKIAAPLVAVLILLTIAASITAFGFITALASSTSAASDLPDRWWVTYGGSYANTRHVDLDQINPSNVASLKLAWKFNTGVFGEFESSPIVVDGVVYLTTGADNSVFALDAATGRLKWRYVPHVGLAPYIFAVNRGVAVANGRVFLTTLDAHLMALDEHTGKPVWDARVGDSRQGLSETAAPLAWNGLVFVGSSGNEFGVRGSFSAYAQKDGRLVWRWWTVSPGWEGKFAATVHGLSLHRDIARERALAAHTHDAWKHGGGAVWMTPALNPKEATIYLSTGNPAPAFNGDRRPGDNLYTDSIVALDARSGKLKWYYQETPHDVWDFDASSPPIVFDALDSSGHPIPAVAEAGKTGLLYILDRRTGKVIRISDSFTAQPLVYHPPSARGAELDFGGTLGPLSYDSALHAAFVDAVIQPQILRTEQLPAWSPSTDQWTGGGSEDTAKGSDILTAIDVNTGHKLWSTPVPSVDFSGLLSTPGLVFLGEQGTGDFRAYDSVTGKVLWNVHPTDVIVSPFDAREVTGQLAYAVAKRFSGLWHRARHTESGFGDAMINSPPIAYRMNGREYILIGSNEFHGYTHAGGDTLFAFTLP